VEEAFLFQAEDGIRDFHVTGVQTCALPICSEMCTSPSMPSATRTKAPNGTSLVTLPGVSWPMAWVRAKTCHGSSCVAFSDSETRSEERRVGKEWRSGGGTAA